MNPQEWSFEAQLTLTSPRAIPMTVGPNGVRVFQQKGVGGEPVTLRTTMAPGSIPMQPQQHVSYSTDGLRSGGLRMECTWHTSPGMQVRSQEVPRTVPPPSFHSAPPSFRRNGQNGTVPRPKSYHMDHDDMPRAASEQTIGRAHSNDDVSTAQPHTQPKSTVQGYKLSTPSHEFSGARECKIDSGIASSGEHPFGGFQETGQAPWRTRSHTSRSSAKEGGAQQRGRSTERACKSTCSIILENNLSPLSEYDAWVKSCSKSSTEPIDGLPYNKSLLHDRAFASTSSGFESSPGDLQDTCSNPLFRPRSQSESQQTYSTHFCTHVAARRAQSYAAARHHKTDPNLLTNVERGILGSKDQQVSPPKEQIKSKASQALNKPRKCRSFSPMVSDVDKAGADSGEVGKSKPRTIHIDVYCSDDESDEGTICNTSDEEENLAACETMDKNENGDLDALSRSSSIEFIRPHAYLKTQSGRHGTALQVSNKSKLKRRSPYRGIKDACDSICPSSEIDASNLLAPESSDLTGVNPLEQIKRRLSPSRYSSARQKPSESPASVVGKTTNEFRQPFTHQGGVKSEHYMTAGAFGNVLPVVRKPGHHVGPTRNKHCFCEHCQSYYASSGVEKLGRAQTAGRKGGTASETGDHVGSSHPF